MSKSKRLKVGDERKLWLLTGECRELGDDRTAWRDHWIAGLANLVDADIGLAGEMAGCLNLKMRDLGVTFWWRKGALDFNFLMAHLARFRLDPRYSPAMIEYYRRYREEAGVCLARTDFIVDGDWYGSRDHQLIQEPMGADATLWCSSPISGAAPGETSNVILLRSANRRDFSLRDRSLIREGQALLAPLVGGPLARFAEPSPSELSPRLRDVLKCLLEGDGDKQIAARLGISLFTVNEYVKQVFYHFGVRSRPELLARWIRRGWTARFQWANSSPANQGDEHMASFEADYQFNSSR